MRSSKNGHPTSISSPGSLERWLLAARPKTLTASLVPVLVAASLAFALRGRYWPVTTLVALTCALALQIGTNFFNDVIDFRKGADKADRLGPPRAAASGWIDPVKLGAAGVYCFIIAALLCGMLVARGGWPI